MNSIDHGLSLSDFLPQSWRQWVSPQKGEEKEAPLPAFSPEFIDRALPFIEPLYKYYFRCEVRGMERIPAKAPIFAVGNHNGMGIAEVPLLLYAWYKRFGHDRPAHGLAHRLIFHWPLAKEIVPRMGAVPAAPDTALELLGAGRDLLVFPGGDWEAGRPFRDRKKIDFGGRKGFVRVALQAGVPVVPFVICGAHETALIFSRGDKLAHFFGLDVSQRLKAMPVTPQFLFAVWKAVQAARGKANLFFLPLWIANAWIAFPWLPSKITIEVLEPIDLRSAIGHIQDEEERLQAGYDLVTGKMQEKLTALYAERKTLLG